jgi:hypothetical protein
MDEGTFAPRLYSQRLRLLGALHPIFDFKSACEIGQTRVYVPDILCGMVHPFSQTTAIEFNLP